MTNNEAAFESFVNIEHEVLGKKLKPLCLLHLLWLYEVQSPLVYTALECSLADLELGVIITSHSTSQSILKGISMKGLGRIRHKLWHGANKKRDLKKEIIKFVAYNNDYLSLPNFHAKEEEQETDEKIPWLMTVAANIIKETGWALDAVLTMPLGKLLWLNLCFGYINTGKTNIMSDKEAFIIEHILKQQP
jgi:hypothetical protein